METNISEIKNSIERRHSFKMDDFTKLLDAFMEELTMTYEYFKQNGNAELVIGTLSSDNLHTLIDMYGKICECEEILKFLSYLTEK